MLDWLESHGHWGYIYSALGLMLVLISADLLPPWLRQRRLREQIRARIRREQP